MFYLIVEVHEPSYREDIYLALQSIGVHRAITVDALDIAAALTDEQTFFTGFFRSDKIEAGNMLLIQAQVSSRSQVKEFLANLREAGVNIDTEKIVTITLLPAVVSFSSEHGYRDDGGQ
ncbi:MAG TPA: hypothetical protein ENN41_07500 [Sediminispirochaeta sp.]|nr:hypothetical protein [Sediminispirochaeta sp.]